MSKTSPFSIRITEKNLKCLKAVSQKKNISISSLINDILTNYLTFTDSFQLVNDNVEEEVIVESYSDIPERDYQKEYEEFQKDIIDNLNKRH